MYDNLDLKFFNFYVVLCWSLPPCHAIFYVC